MYAFSKKLQYPGPHPPLFDRRHDEGWEVREERDSEVVRQAHYQDWHRVERARRSFAITDERPAGEGLGGGPISNDQYEYQVQSLFELLLLISFVSMNR